MTTFSRVTTANDEDATARWRGEEVEDQPGDAAERAADRAEGNAPIRADEESKRQRELSEGEPADPVALPEGDQSSAQDKIAEAAEEHRERHPAHERPPRGKL
jgi:hypothetical protein